MRPHFVVHRGWRQVIEGTSNAVAYSVVVDATGDVFVGGGLGTRRFNTLKFLVTKFDGRTGVERWRQVN
jgi:hypothetical protein